MKTLIVEDESYVRTGLKKLLADCAFDVEVIGECASVNDAVVVCKACQPELVLLDVNLEDGTGFDFLNQTLDLSFKVIFITAYEEFAIQAIKFGAVDYILKPIDKDELEQALAKLQSQSSEHKTEQTHVIQDYLKGQPDRIVLRMQSGLQIVRLENLMYCQSDGGYTRFFLDDGRHFIASKTLKDYESELPNRRFVRCHQSYLINLDHVDRLDKERLLFLKNGEQIPVSVRKKEELLEKIYNRS